MNTSKHPDYFKFGSLAILLDCKISKLITDCKKGYINNLHIQLLDKRSTGIAQAITDRLKPVLNKYARDHIADGPIKILISNEYSEVKLTNAQLNRLIRLRKSDTFFDLWLKSHNIDIEFIYIVIPKDDVIDYILHLKNVSEISGKNRLMNISDAEKYVDDCLAKGKSKKDIAIDLVEKYGSEKQRYYGVIGKKLAGYDNPHVSPEALRLRGFRFYNKIKNSVQSKPVSKKQTQ